MGEEQFIQQIEQLTDNFECLSNDQKEKLRTCLKSIKHVVEEGSFCDRYGLLEFFLKGITEDVCGMCPLRHVIDCSAIDTALELLNGE